MKSTIITKHCRDTACFQLALWESPCWYKILIHACQTLLSLEFFVDETKEMGPKATSNKVPQDKGCSTMHWLHRLSNFIDLQSRHQCITSLNASRTDLQKCGNSLIRGLTKRWSALFALNWIGSAHWDTFILMARAAQLVTCIAPMSSECLIKLRL